MQRRKCFTGKCTARTWGAGAVCYRYACSGPHPVPWPPSQEEQLGPQTVAPLPGAPPVELPAIPTDFPPLPDVKLPYIEQV